MLSPHANAVLRELARVRIERLDVLTDEACREQRAGVVEERRELAGRARDVDRLVADRPRLGPLVDGRPWDGVLLAALGDGDHPPSQRGRVEQDVDDLRHVRLALAARVRAVRVDRLGVARRGSAVFAVDDGPQAEGVGRLAAERVHAWRAQVRRRATARAIVVSEPGTERIADADARACRRRQAAEVAALGGRARRLGQRGLAGVEPEEAGGCGACAQVGGEGHGRTSRSSCCCPFGPHACAWSQMSPGAVQR